jgi:NhaP-type Na+/H+ or K+/H+ antiporter
MGQEDYQDLASFLRKLIRRLKVLQGAEGLCLTAICLLLAFSLGLAVEELRAYFPYLPVVYAFITLILLGLALGWTVFQLLKRVSQERAALYVENQHPKLKNNLINSLQL